MRLSRAISVLAVALLPLAPGAPAIAADNGSDSAAGRIGGLIQPGRPRIDPTSPWLLSSGWPMDGSYRLIDRGRTLGPLGDGLSPWLLADRTTVDTQRMRGARFAGTVVMSDPRFIGWLTMTWNRDIHLTAGPSASVDAVRLRLDGHGGSWVGSLTGEGDPVTGSFRLAGTLTGTKGYDGLTAVLAIVCPGGSDDGWIIDGLVIAGGMPPVG